MSSEIEQWLEQNTGWCERFRLRVSPDKCRKWSAGQRNNWAATGISTYQEDCVGCPGPKMQEGIVPSPKFVPADKEKVSQAISEVKKLTAKCKFYCEIHGPHNEWTLPGGNRFSQKCPICVEERRQTASRKKSSERIFLNFSGNEWLQEWMQKRAEDQGTDIATMVMREMIALVPAEFIKKEILRRI